MENKAVCPGHKPIRHEDGRYSCRHCGYPVDPVEYEDWDEPESGEWHTDVPYKPDWEEADLYRLREIRAEIDHHANDRTATTEANVDWAIQEAQAGRTVMVARDEDGWCFSLRWQPKNKSKTG